MRGKELFEKMTDIDGIIIDQAEDCNKQKKPIYLKWVAIAACFLLLLTVSPIMSHFFNEVHKSPAHFEVYFKLNDKIYSVIHTPLSPAYEMHDLEEVITSDMLGEYLGETKIRVDIDGNEDTFKLYRYVNTPITEYDWMPLIIAKSSEGIYYYALIGSVFDEKKQTANEVLTVYSISSAESIVSIENEKGNKITDKDFIEEFYNGLFTKEYGGNNFLQENVYQNTGIDESEIGELYSKYADNVVYLRVKLSNGLVIGVHFTSHNYVSVGNELYFKVEDNWLDLVSTFK